MSSWSYIEIMEYFKVCKTTAIKIKNRAIKEHNGSIAYGSNLAKTDSILALYGTSRKEELNALINFYEKKL